MPKVNQSFLVCNTYWAQWTDSDYWNRLMYAIELATQFNENIVLVGDLNSNLFCVNKKSSAKSLRNSILFLTLRILRLQREIVLSKMTFCELEELGPWGPGLVSTLPTKV
jgi:hypothetical protein